MPAPRILAIEKNNGNANIKNVANFKKKMLMY
jgi:hypothetical protein